MLGVLALLGLGACSTSPVAGNPLSRLERVASIAFEGQVVERLDAGGYSYLRLQDGRWVVGLDKGHREGDAVRVLPVGLAHDFESRKTGRTFGTLTFGVLGRP
jgi:hypothetical protein